MVAWIRKQNDNTVVCNWVWNYSTVASLEHKHSARTSSAGGVQSVARAPEHTQTQSPDTGGGGVGN